MYSFDPCKLRCGCCRAPVLGKRLVHGDAERRVIVLTDQNFCAMAPATGGGQCLKVIRLEDGGLLELFSLYAAWIRGLGLRVPAGSVLLVGSASYLAAVGTAAYAEEFGLMYGRLRGLHGGEVHVMPAPMLLLDGTTDSALVACMAELSGWLRSVYSTSDAGYSEAAVEAAKLVTEAGWETTVTDPNRRLMMPSSLLTSVKRIWMSGGGDLPGGASPLPPALEAVVLASLIDDINRNLAFDLDTKPCLVRDNVTLGLKERPTLIVLGSSNAALLGDSLEEKGLNVIRLIEPGWRVTKAKVARLTDLLAKEMLNHDVEKVAVVFQLLDSSFFLARTEEGGLIPARRELGGGYHVDGDLILIPREMQFHCLSTIKPLLEAARDAKKVLVTPIPRYVLKPCCQDDRHIPNIKEEDYRRKMEDGLFECRKNLRDFTFRLGIRNVAVLGALKELRKLGDEVWADPVHMSKAGYSCLSGLVETVLKDMGDKHEAGVSRGKKRGRETY